MDRKKKEAIALLRTKVVNDVARIVGGSLVGKLISKGTTKLIQTEPITAVASDIILVTLVRLMIISYNEMVLIIRELVPKYKLMGV